MKKILLLLLLLFINIILSAQDTYYVSPRGNDSNDGADSSAAHAWLTWGKGFSAASVDAGDTVYFLGGVYYTTAIDGKGYTLINDGIIGNYIHYWAYPGGTPILDCSTITSDDGMGTPHVYAIHAAINYCHFKGLTIRNIWEQETDYYYGDDVLPWDISGSNSIFENCIIYNTGGHAFVSRSGHEIYYINCDAYNCANYDTPVGQGERGVGFYTNNTSHTDTRTFYIYCRAWKCSDQGFAHYDVGYVEHNGCWSVLNGKLNAGGHGFKIGFSPSGTATRKIYNCIAAYNRSSGINCNDNNQVAQDNEIYNNICYHNGYYADYSSWGWGFLIFNTTSTDAEELERIFKNNISYANAIASYQLSPGALWTHEYNTWNTPPNVTVSDADFQSVDSTGITGLRQSDGSLPNLSGFLHLVTGSDLRNAGTNLGLIYDGDGNLWNNPTPSLGAFELPVVEPILVTSIDIWGTGGVTTIEVEDGTLQMLKKTLPINATDTTVTWYVIYGTGEGSISSSGLVTAFTDGTVTIRATANDDSEIYGEEELTFSNQSPNAGLPTVYTSNPTSWTAVSIYLGDNVIADDGGGTISDKGVCWSTTGVPTIADNHAHCGTGTASFAYTIKGLKGNTLYHFRAFATNEEGTSYGGADNTLTTRPFSVFSIGKRIRYNGKFLMKSR